MKPKIPNVYFEKKMPPLFFLLPVKKKRTLSALIYFYLRIIIEFNVALLRRHPPIVYTLKYQHHTR